MYVVSVPAHHIADDVSIPGCDGSKVAEKSSHDGNILLLKRLLLGGLCNGQQELVEAEATERQL